MSAWTVEPLDEQGVVVRYGDHCFFMTAAEAEALTAAMVAQMADEDDAINAAIQRRLRIEAEAQDSVTAAANEDGVVMLKVWCGKCANADPVAVVRQSSAGAVWDAHGNLEMDPERERHLRDEFRRRSGRRVPFVARGRDIHLLGEAPPTLAAACPVAGHGTAEVDSSVVRDEISRFDGKHPRKLTINR